MNPIFSRLGAIPRNGGFRMQGYWVWGSSVVKGEDGKYHMFASRIPRDIPFHPGWMIASEIVRAVSETPIGPYRFEEVVLPPRGAQYWDGRTTHNPRMVKVGDTYVLFYMGSTHPFEDVTNENVHEFNGNSKWCTVGRANKRIGVATSRSVFGPWQRYDKPVLDTCPDTFYSFLTSNPAPVIEPDGKTWLIFKSRAYEGNGHGGMSIGLATADHFTGLYRVVSPKPIFSHDQFGVIEDPCIWKDQDTFYMLAKDQHSTITGEWGAGVLAYSTDCQDWKPYPEPKAYSRTITWEDGFTETLANMERCSVLFDDQGKPSHLFFAVWQGSQGFTQTTVESVAWNMVLPLK